MTWNWRGNLRDDCTAVGSGLMLRAEMMDRSVWWWAVYDNEGKRGSNELASSNRQEPYHAKTGKEARTEAEAAAERALQRQGSTND